MAKEKIVERDHHTNTEATGEATGADGPALDAGDTRGGSGSSSALTTVRQQQGEISVVRGASDVPDVTDRLFETTLDLSKGIMAQYDEQYGYAMAMYRHYSEAAVNDSEVEAGGMLTADEMALKWLEESRRITEDKKKYLETLLAQANRSKIEREKMAAQIEREKIKSGAGPKKVSNTQNNTLIIGQNNRDRIHELEKLTGGVSGRDGLPELEIVDKDGFKGVLPGDYKPRNEDKEEVIASPKEMQDESDDDWLHGEDG